MGKTKPSRNPVFEEAAKTINRGSPKASATVVVARNAKTGRFTTETSAKSIDKNVVKYADALRRLANK